MRTAHPGVVLGLHRSRHERDVLDVAAELGIRRLDTSYNYCHFTAHRALRSTAGTLLNEFEISTKVGFFPGESTGPEHDLDPVRLREAVETSARELGRPPELVFLHNPERSVHALRGDTAIATLAKACAALQECVQSGSCAAWGIATWDPRPIVSALAGRTSVLPSPSVVMVRAGLLVSADVLDASEALATVLDVPRSSRWGMSPFGGDAADPVWQKVDSRMFVEDRVHWTREQAAFRAAGELPGVGQIVVGTNNPDHLRDLVAAANQIPDLAVIATYRNLIGQARSAPAPTAT